MSLFNFRLRERVESTIAPTTKAGKIYKMVQLIGISMFFSAVALILLEIVQLLKLKSSANGVICSIGVLGIGLVVALPWVRVFENYKDEKMFKIMAIVFLSIIGVCIILWIVSVWQIVGLVNGLTSETEEALNKVEGSLNVIRVSLIVSLQFIIATYVAMNVIKYRKTLLPYQIMAGVSMFLIDIYLSLALTAISITGSGIKFNSTSEIVRNQGLIAMFVVAIALFIFPSTIFARADKKKIIAARKAAAKEAALESENLNGNKAPEANKASEADNAQPKTESLSVDEKLRKIKTLLDDGLITQEEYEAKRADIINNL